MDKKTWYRFCKSLISWLGTPYAHFEMTKGKGADCALFIAACLKEIGLLKEINYTYHPRFWHNFTKQEVILDHIANIIKEGCNLKKVSDKFMAGDILTFALKSDVTNHVAVYMGNDLIINSMNSRGVCIIPLKYFKKNLTNIYRIHK